MLLHEYVEQRFIKEPSTDIQNIQRKNLIATMLRSFFDGVNDYNSPIKDSFVLLPRISYCGALLFEW